MSENATAIYPEHKLEYAVVSNIRNESLTKKKLQFHRFCRYKIRRK